MVNDGKSHDDFGKPHDEVLLRGERHAGNDSSGIVVTDTKPQWI